MLNISYYRILNDIDNNFCSDDIFLRVNCTGHSIYKDEVTVSSSRHDYYLIYLYNGVIHIKSPLVKKQLYPGDIVIFHPESLFIYSKPQGMELEYFWVHFTGNSAAEILKQCGLKTNCIFAVGKHECIRENFQMLFQTFLFRDNLFEFESALQLSSLLLNIGKSIYNPSTDGLQSSFRIHRSLSYIHNNISHPLRVGLLASMENMSISRFRVIFRQITRLSPQEYIKFTKLNSACELLKQTKLSIKEISYAVG